MDILELLRQVKQASEKPRVPLPYDETIQPKEIAPQVFLPMVRGLFENFHQIPASLDPANPEHGAEIFTSMSYSEACEFAKWNGGDNPYNRCLQSVVDPQLTNFAPIPNPFYKPPTPSGSRSAFVEALKCVQNSNVKVFGKINPSVLLHCENNRNFVSGPDGVGIEGFNVNGIVHDARALNVEIHYHTMGEMLTACDEAQWKAALKKVHKMFIIAPAYGLQKVEPGQQFAHACGKKAYVDFMPDMPRFVRMMDSMGRKLHIKPITAGSPTKGFNTAWLMCIEWKEEKKGKAYEAGNWEKRPYVIIDAKPEWFTSHWNHPRSVGPDSFIGHDFGSLYIARKIDGIHRKFFANAMGFFIDIGKGKALRICDKHYKEMCGQVEELKVWKEDTRYIITDYVYRDQPNMTFFGRFFDGPPSALPFECYLNQFVKVAETANLLVEQEGTDGFVIQNAMDRWGHQAAAIKDHLDFTVNAYLQKDGITKVASAVDGLNGQLVHAVPPSVRKLFDGHILIDVTYDNGRLVFVRTREDKKNPTPVGELFKYAYLDQLNVHGLNRLIADKCALNAIPETHNTNLVCLLVTKALMTFNHENPGVPMVRAYALAQTLGLDYLVMKQRILCNKFLEWIPGVVEYVRVKPNVDGFFNWMDEVRNMPKEMGEWEAYALAIPHVDQKKKFHILFGRPLPECPPYTDDMC